MIDKAATHEADDGTLHTAVDAVDHLGNDVGYVAPPKSTGARFAVFVSILALSFTAIGIAAGYKHWQRMNDKARSNEAEIATLREQLQSVPTSDALNTLRQDLGAKTAQALSNNDQALQEMARLQNQTRQFADTVASQVEQVTFLQAKMQQSATPASANEWQITEVEFLLQLAGRQLHLAQDVRTAITALKEADGLLAKVGSVNYLTVRQQIARDISALEAVPVPDIVGVSQRINALMLGLKPLPALSSTPVAGESVTLTDTTEADVTGNSLWADYKRKALETLNEAIVIRQHDKPLQMQLDADARLHLFQLLQLRLENLRLLVLQRDHVGFRAQLALIQETLSEYYPSDQAKSVLAELDDIGKLELQPVIPDISASLKQLESARHAEASRVIQEAESNNAETTAVDTGDEEASKAAKPAKTTDKAKPEGGKRE
ncbi:HemX protein [Thiothrix caldifontis]|uniref:HemX protein n=1 Tax=Thiothrix caldifontis TaxID=525918 RepID=A0A1H3X368_9GAMM|nr:uroporphyrinogen-III C-methyltransferase [Thiothrix caldifontis]SDZ92958.1 HemX protein [Thiothrix caldifontis]